MNKPLWGIDLGGTKIEGVILKSMDDPTPVLRTRIDTEGHKGYEHIVQQIVKLVTLMQDESGLTPAHIGMGTPGVLDPLLQTMKNCNSTALNGRPLKKDIEELLGIPFELANDANCFALAEARLGVVKQEAPDARFSALSWAQVLAAASYLTDRFGTVPMALPANGDTTFSMNRADPAIAVKLVAWKRFCRDPHCRIITLR